MDFIKNLRLLLIALWLGAAIFFSASVAQSAFALIESRELAGSLVSRNLAALNYAGLAISIIALLLSFIYAKGIIAWMERALLLIFAGLCAVGQFIIGYQLSLIRSQAGRPIEELSADEPMRIAFTSLHQYSVWVLVAAAVAALISFILIAAWKAKVEAKMPLNDLGQFKF